MTWIGSIGETIGGPAVLVVDEVLKKEQKENEETMRRRSKGAVHTPSATRGETFYNNIHRSHYIPEVNKGKKLVIPLLVGGIVLIYFLG